MSNIVLLFAAIGFFVVGMLICAFISNVVVPKVKQLMRRQSKIRCLCKHEYVVMFRKHLSGGCCYDLECRKCGKEKEITIYDRGMKDE